MQCIFRYDSEYDDLRLASASAGGPIMSDGESDLPPDLEIDLNNILDNMDKIGQPLVQIQLPTEDEVIEAVEVSEQHQEEEVEEEEVVSKLEDEDEKSSKVETTETEVVRQESDEQKHDNEET